MACRNLKGHKGKERHPRHMPATDSKALAYRYILQPGQKQEGYEYRNNAYICASFSHYW